MTFQEILLRNRRMLLEELGDTTCVVEVLYMEKCLSKRQYQEVNAAPIQLDKSGKLIDFVSLMGEEGFFCFCDSLQENYKWLSDHLKQEAANCVKVGAGPRASDDGCSAEIKNVVPTEKQLMKISKIIATHDWELVVIELGLHFCDVDRCKASHHNPKMQCMAALVHWLRTNGDAAKFSPLYNAAQDAGCSFSDLKQLIDCMK